MEGQRSHTLKTVVIALVAGMVGANAPAIAHGVHAAFAHNADKVDGIHAVKSSVSIAKRQGKLVATDPTTGKLPNDIIDKAPDSELLDGLDSTEFAASAHAHDAAETVSGVFSDDRLPDTITRDSELQAHNHDGAYAPSGHNHDGAYAGSGHNHDGAYADSSHGHAAGDITSGTLADARIPDGIARDGEIPGAGTGLMSSAGAFHVNTSTIQARVTGGCSTGTFITSVLANGAVTCGPGNNGDITEVTAGAGLTGGASSGIATLAANFTFLGGDNGVAYTVARGDHHHDSRYDNRYLHRSPTSAENGKVWVNGLVRSGNETGAAPPLVAGSSYDGMVTRRIFSREMTAGVTVARTDSLSLERDGTQSGLQLSWSSPASSTRRITCIGLDGNSNVVTASVGVPGSSSSGTAQVYTNAQEVIYTNCSFGYPYGGGHLTQVTLQRERFDFYWSGTVTSTVNQ